MRGGTLLVSVGYSVACDGAYAIATAVIEILSATVRGSSAGFSVNRIQGRLTGGVCLKDPTILFAGGPRDALGVEGDRERSQATRSSRLHAVVPMRRAVDTERHGDAPVKLFALTICFAGHTRPDIPDLHVAACVIWQARVALAIARGGLGGALLTGASDALVEVLQMRAVDGVRALDARSVGVTL